MIGLAAERFTKNLWSERAVRASGRSSSPSRDEADQARYVVERVLEKREAGIALEAQAVLFRASHHSGPLEIELTRRNIPFVKFGGLKFLDAAHVKDVLALLRFAENPRDRVAGFRVLQLLPGVGPTTAAQRPRRASAEAPDARPRSPRFAPPPRAADDWPALRRSSFAACARRRRLAGRARAGAPLVRAASRAHPRGRAGPRAPTSCSSSRSPPAIPRASAS